MNIDIRNAISALVTKNGPLDSRAVISLMAQQFSTSKQRICGNLSFMICKAQTLRIIRNRPHSIIYI